MSIIRLKICWESSFVDLKYIRSKSDFLSKKKKSILKRDRRKATLVFPSGF